MADESSIRTLLLADATVNSLISNRLYDQRKPENLAGPASESYVIMTVISTTPENMLDAAPGVDQYRIQFDIYALNKSACKTILTAFRNVLAGVGYEALSQDFLDENTDLKRILLHFDFFIAR
jgi:hypothetical protein